VSFQHREDIIGIFTRHPVAANLLMVMMLLAGVWGLGNLNAQFFPNFEVEVVTVRTVWSGASAEDVERSLTLPLEQVLRDLDGLDRMRSTSARGVSVITLEFPEGTDMGEATSRVDQTVKQVRNLPVDAEDSRVQHVVRYEPVARLLVHGPADAGELRHLVRRMERELLDRGIARIGVLGLPDEEMAIQVPERARQALGLSLADIAHRVAAFSRDVPAGTVGRDDVGRELRATTQARNEAAFDALPLVAGEDGRLVRLGDVADIARRARPAQVLVSYRGWPAVELALQRSPNTDSLALAQVMQEWLAEVRNRLPPNVELTVYDESWQLIRERIDLLLRNGLGGLVLVIAILFLFLNGRMAWWVALGIPVSFMATLAIMYVAGGSINMISLFALIMALGIIVDDAIVVGEDALVHYQSGENPLEAAEGGARRMLAPVMSSSLTTIAAFIPLFVVSGFIGKILGDIPFVIVCVIVASLIESFLVLPGHLRHSFPGMHHAQPSPFRQRWDAVFARFRDGPFRCAVIWAVHHRAGTLVLAFSSIVLLAGLMAGGRLGFSFFPNVPGNVVVASASFVAGTPPARVHRFIDQVEQALYATDAHFGGGLVRVARVSYGLGYFSNARQIQRGDQFASIMVELTPTDSHTVGNERFIVEWRARLNLPPGLEYLTTTVRMGGHPGRDIEIRLGGAGPERLKQAALDLSQALTAVPGVESVEDDMPYGQQQLVFRLLPYGEALGLTVDEVAKQLRAAFDGQLVQIFNEDDEEIEVRVMLPDSERHRLAALDEFRVSLPSGSRVPLDTVVEFGERWGYKTLRHEDGRLAVKVYADVDKRITGNNAVRARLAETVLPELERQHDIHWEFTGRAEDQAETMADMKHGALFALAMIYIVLTWVFGSYGWPLVVMAIIPFGVVGALLGHFFMGITPTILSMFGMFTLSGIAVNDSIILVVFYKQLRQQGMAVREALVEAACQRLRAVLLTSLTTIAGLLPLLFETSLQAQFLIPMAVSISFGLMFTTFLVLFLVPSLLSAMEDLFQRSNPGDSAMDA